MSSSTARRVIGTALAAAALGSGAAFAQPAAGYPNKPIRLVNPFAPGGPVDIIGRAVAQELNKSWGQPVIVDNRPGAGTTIGAGLVARAAPDGYTLMVTSVSTPVSVTIYRNLPFDLVKDFAPVVLLAQTPLVFAVSPGVPAANVQEFIKLARAKPGQVSYASSGAGTISHLAGELFRTMAKIDSMVHVPYKGGAPAVAAVAGGETQAVFDQGIAIMPHAKAGRLRALGVTSAKRVDSSPELPTFAEAGVPGFEVNVWTALYAPAGTPAPVVERLNAEVNRILREPEMRDRLNGLGLAPVGGTSAAFGEYLKSEIARWGKVVKDAGVKLE